MHRLLLASGLLATFALPALAANQDFTLFNKTGYQIDEVYVGPVSSDDWGKDIMGKGALGDNESVAISFTAPASVCKWDMKVKYSDGEVAEWHNLDLCSISKVSLFWNKAAGTSRAVTE